MLPARILSYLRGYVRVEVSGKHPERLVNLCLRAGFPVWDLETKEGKILFSMPVGNYKGIRDLARKAKCVPRVVGRVGLPFLVARIRRRPVFVVTSAAILLVLYYLAGCVWAIEVKGNRTVPRDVIIQAAQEAGLRVGARKSRISPGSVESYILLQVPELSWAYVRFQGVCAVIETVEKVRPEVESPGDVVAAKNGIIESVLVLSGIPLVRPGQTVREGQLLIAGNPHGGIKGARGTVLARTYYEVYREIPLNRTVPVRTGRKVEFTVLRISGVEIALFGMRPVFEWYEVEDYPIWESRNAPAGISIQLLSRSLYEVQWKLFDEASQETIAFWEQQSKRSIERQLPSSAKLIDFSCKVERVSPELLVFRGTACVIEDIGVIKPW